MNRSTLATSYLPLAMLVAGCSREYLPREPHLVEAPSIHVVADRVSISFGRVRATVDLLTAALPGVRLRSAKLASIRTEPCAGGLPFETIRVDGTDVHEGPVDIAGNRDIEVTFSSGSDALRSPLRGSTALDLETDSPGGAGCIRVPLGADVAERTWRPDPTSVGFTFGLGARAYPAAGAYSEAASPVAMAVERLGGASERGTLYVELAVGASAPGHFGISTFGVGGDRVLWTHGVWGFTGGVAYDVVLSSRIGVGLQYVLHGPRLTPALTWSPLSSTTSAPGFPNGRRSHYFALEVPVSGWFGTGGAPAFVLSPGVGLTFYLTM